jgi:hypothetical protein
MDILRKTNNLQDCLSSIRQVEQLCERIYKPKLCEKVQPYCIDYCYRRFGRPDTKTSIT